MYADIRQESLMFLLMFGHAVRELFMCSLTSRATMFVVSGQHVV